MNNEVRIEGIFKNYGNVEALQDISLDIHSGELFGLIGADGAGKTTLFRILTTVLLADWMSFVIIRRSVRWSVICPVASPCIRT